jgi:uncharacterized protein YdhG (YjbR/CyaY superfamily)
MATKTKGTTNGLTAEERAAMKERIREVKADAARDKIAEMPPGDRAMAERIHEIVKAAAPTLSPKTWYGMPAYAKNGNVICFFQSAAKFKARYATFGFNEDAQLDDGPMWPTSWALKDLTPEAEATITALVKKAVAEP